MISSEHSERLERLLDRLNAASDLKDMAVVLGISRKTLSKIINERGSLTPDMALR